MNRLDEAEHLLNKYSCQCGSGGAMACEDDCPGDVTNDDIKEVLRLVIGELRALNDPLRILEVSGGSHRRLERVQED
jgi:hypothetical protein